MAQLYSYETILLSITTLFLLYKYFTRSFSYWENKGVPFIKPTLFFGNYFDVVSLRKTIAIKLKEMYDATTGPCFGMWVFGTPHLVIRSPELVKQILVKDFSYFNNRTIAANKNIDEMGSYVLFALQNSEWKTIRTKMTPVFTSGKMKCMIPLMNSVGEDLTTYLTTLTAKQDSFEAREVCAKYATDVITSCAFGVQGKSFQSDDAPWRKVGKDMFDFTLSNGIRGVTYFFLPEMVNLFKIKLIPPHVSKFLREAFWQTIQRREKDHTNRNDLIDIIVKLKQEGDLDAFDGDKLVAQAVQFFLAGFETTSSTIGFTLYELCLNKSIQKQLISEIKSSIKEEGGITYDAVVNMKYLHKVVQETLRKYPVLPFLDRRCAMDYKLPGTDIVLDKGTPVYISLLGIQYDPEYYPNPNVFDPERFSEENSNSRPSCAYIPFGTGPHNCIGERFGLLSTKIALVHILSHFEVEQIKDTPVPIQFEAKSFTLASKTGLPMRFIDTRRQASIIF